MEDYLSRFADWAVPNSEAGKEYLTRRGINPSRIRVIRNGLNLDRLTTEKGNVEQIRHRLGVPPGGNVVGILARLFPQKDHVTFLRAAAIVNQIIPDTRFALVGDGPLRSSLEKLSQELGVASKTTFFGEQQDVGTYLSTFDVAVSSSEAEGCSNSILVDNGETGFLVPLGDTEALAEAIVRLLRDPDMARLMGQRAREKVTNQFSMNNMVHQYQSLYEETLRQKIRQVKKKT
jgi:glycosyltransferase involved in cell wall biosynthesis